MSEPSKEAMEAARKFVQQQSGGEWGHEIEEADAENLAVVIDANAAKVRKEVALECAAIALECSTRHGSQDHGPWDVGVEIRRRFGLGDGDNRKET